MQLPAPPRTEGHPATVICLNDGKVLCTYSGRRDAAGAFTASSGVFLYDGTSWTDKSKNNNMYYWCKDVVLDPNDASQNTWYVGVFKGWGSTVVNNAGGGLWKTTDRGTTWTHINSLDRVTSCTFDPNNANRIFMTTETEGLWYSDNVNDATPVFTQVTTYPFRQPERVYFNPFNTAEVWVTSFGNGLRIGSETSCVPPTVSISAEGPTIFCKGESVVLDAAVTGTAGTYQWTLNSANISGATNASFTASDKGDYTVTVSNPCGSASSNTIHITVNKKPKADVTPSGTVNMCAGETTTLTASAGTNYAYQWKKNGKNISGATNISYDATDAGKYKVIVTNTSTGCTKSSKVTTINITCKEELPVAGGQLSVLPNPSSDEFTMELNEESEVRVYDVLGRMIQEFHSANGEIVFGKELRSGVYFVEVDGAEGKVLRKIVKE